jgi:tetratricopeptide (TPR) repeat protein
LTWALDRAEVAVALELVGELGDYWWRSRRWADGRPWADAALELSGSAPPQVRARALLCRARLVGARRPEPHRHDLEAGLALFRVGDDAAGVALCLAHLAAAEGFAGRHERATALVDEAISLAQAADAQDALAFALVQSVATPARYEQAAGRARAAITHLERIGDLRQSGFVCNLVAYQAIAEGRYEDALAWLDRGLIAARSLDDPNLVYLIRGNQGVANLFLDRPAEAGQRFRDALAVCREGGTEDIIDETLFGLAAATAKQGDLERAAQLVGAARAHPSPGNSATEAAVWLRMNDRVVAPARDRFGPENWDDAERRGGTLTITEAIDLALARGRFAGRASGALSRSRS